MKLERRNDENYAARLVILNEFEPMSNCQNIQIARIKGYSVIVSKEIEAGTKGVFFPVESQISKSFLSSNNLFSDKLLNKNQEKTGFFEKKGRVKAIKLRATPSEGFFVTLEHFTEWLNIPVSEWNSVPVDTLFDTVNGEELCRKYVIPVQTSGQPRAGRKIKKQPSRLVAGQFHLHYSTPKLLDNIHFIEPDDTIFVLNKLHGCNFSTQRVLVKRKLSVWEKIKKLFGVKIVLTEYDNIYSSRGVIKNSDYTSLDNHYYDSDVWKITFEKVKSYLSDGLGIYAEIVGFTESGKMIQKGYHYGCKPGEQNYYIFRITETDKEGNVTEWPISKVIEFCQEKGLNHVPVFYQGRAKDLFPDISVEQHWHREFAARLRASFNLEKPCELNNCEVFAEGVTIKIDNKPNIPALKLKAFRFLTEETKQLDKGEVDIESQESLKEE